nr:DNA polymerase III subunit delta [Spelaeicoccus albus]
MVTGSESVLADRAVSSIQDQAREADPAIELTNLEASSYESGQLATLTSPSLFGETKLLIVDGVEATNDAFLTDAVNYLEDIQSDVTLVLRHGGGVRGKKLLDAVKASGAPVIEAQPLKKESERSDFAAGEFRRAGRTIRPAALRALLDAVGADLGELAAGCRQLIEDTSGTIDARQVELYYGGRVEATGFKVADAAVAGRTAQALSLVRHAVATGVDPVPLVAAMAMKLRGMAKVSALGRGTSPGQLGMAPWQVDRARREVARWTPDGLADAIGAVAEADRAVKGAGRDPVYALEKMLTTVAAAARRPR